MRKSVIVIDLDVVTVHLWKGSQAGESTEFMEKIIGFYKKNAREVSTEEIEEKLENYRVSDKEFIIKLLECGVKEEDAALVMVASLFNADYLVTFNRKHLKNKEHEIDTVLKLFNLPKIKIRSPKEVLLEAEVKE